MVRLTTTVSLVLFSITSFAQQELNTVPGPAGYRPATPVVKPHPEALAPAPAATTPLVLPVASPTGKVNTSPMGSRHVTRHLTQAQCSAYVTHVVQLGLDKLETNVGLQEALNVLAADCGLGEDPQTLSGQTALYVIEGSRFAIYNDGQKVSFGESALAVQEFGLIRRSQVENISQDTLKLVAAAPTPKRGFVAKITDRLKEIYKDGKEVVYFSGFAYHDRNTYTKEKLAELNEKAWGFGYGRERINENGNYESINLMTFLDSHNDPSYTLAYFWQKLFRVSGSTTLGAGFTAGLTSRSDILHHVPIPYAFPAFSVNVGKYSLMSILIPKLNGGINHGAVLFLFLKVPLDNVEFTNLKKR